MPNLHRLFALLAGVAAVGLVLAVVRLVRLLRGTMEATCPLQEEAALPLPAAGPRTLYVQAPRGANLSRLALELLDPQGEPVPLQAIRVPMVVRGLTTVKVSFAHFCVRQPGPHRLRSRGRPADAAALAAHVHRRHGLALLGAVLAVVLAALATVGGGVLALVLAPG